MTVSYREPFSRFDKRLPSSITKALEKRGFASPEIIIKWPSIVGDDLAAKYSPSKITRGVNNSLVLELASKDPSCIYRFPYVRSEIVEKINFYFGRLVFTDIKLARK